MGRTSGGIQPTTSSASADVLDAFLLSTASAGATAVLAVPAGRTWQGTVAISVTVANAAASTVAGSAVAVVSTAGAGVVPAAGNYLRCAAYAGQDTAASVTGTQGSNALSAPFTIVAPAGNAVQAQVLVTVAGSAGEVAVAFIGALV